MILDIPVSLLLPLILSPCLPNHHQEGSSVNRKKITEAEQQLNKKLLTIVQKNLDKMNQDLLLNERKPISTTVS